jgi:hypothetical protein
MMFFQPPREYMAFMTGSDILELTIRTSATFERFLGRILAEDDYKSTKGW